MKIYTAENMGITRMRGFIIILTVCTLPLVYLTTVDPLLTARIGVAMGFIISVIGALLESQTIYFTHPKPRWTNIRQWTLGMCLMATGIVLFISSMIAIGQLPREVF